MPAPISRPTSACSNCCPTRHRSLPDRCDDPATRSRTGRGRRKAAERQKNTGRREAIGPRVDVPGLFFSHGFLHEPGWHEQRQFLLRPIPRPRSLRREERRRSDAEIGSLRPGRDLSRAGSAHETDSVDLRRLIVHSRETTSRTVEEDRSRNSTGTNPRLLESSRSERPAGVSKSGRSAASEGALSEASPGGVRSENRGAAVVAADGVRHLHSQLCGRYQEHHDHTPDPSEGVNAPMPIPTVVIEYPLPGATLPPSIPPPPPPPPPPGVHMKGTWGVGISLGQDLSAG